MATVLLIAVLVVIAVVVFTPGPPDAAGQHDLWWFFYRAHEHGLPGWISFELVETSSNIAMFAPIGLLGALALRRHTWLVVVAAAALSGLIELGQSMFLPERVASLPDVLANTGGALLGWLIALPWIRRHRRIRVSASQGRRLVT